jgi:putative ABC transport system permease protein
MTSMTFWNDVRYGVRMLRKSPGFAITSIITLSLGIGATTAVYSVSDALLWKPVPLPHLETMVMIGQRLNDPDAFNSITAGDIEDVRHQSTSIDRIAMFDDQPVNLVGTGGQPERVTAALVSANFFDTMEVKPARGRAFEAGEDQPGHDREIIFSDAFWRNRFGGDPDIVGRTIRVDDQNFAVVGVMAPKFEFPLATDVWIPMALTPQQRNSRTAQVGIAVARLTSGHTLPQATAELEGIASHLRSAYPDTNKNRHFAVWAAHRFLVDRETNDYLIMLLASVCFVLLIACVNVANLQFARATGRLREVAVRTALGAGRRRIVTQLVTESLMLSLAGAGLGLAVAVWGLNLIRAGMPAEIEKYIVGWKEIHLDGRALAFMLMAAVASGILAGLAPAWQNSRPNLTDTLKEGGRGGSGSRGHHRLRNILVGAEVTLAVVLLVGAGLMMRGFHNLMVSGEQLDPDSLLTMRLSLTDTKYHEPFQRAAYYRQVLDRIAAIPGVRTVAAATAMPYSGHSNGRIFAIEGRPVEPDNVPQAMYQVVSTSYFETLRVPLRAGRFLNDGDGADAPRVIVISEQLAARWWKNESPIGRHIKLGAADSTQPWMTIVGVVGNIVHNPYDREPRREMFVPYQQNPGLALDLGVRAAGSMAQVAPEVTAAIHSVDPEEPVSEMRTLRTALHNRAIGLNYVEILMGIFGALALVLAAVGIYGVMSYMVSEQTHDIGVRMALGAQRENVLTLIFSRGMLTAAAGLAIGLPISYWLARQLEHLIFGVKANDLATFIGIPMALLAVTALAIYIPARRAMRISPVVALRYE